MGMMLQFSMLLKGLDCLRAKSLLSSESSSNLESLQRMVWSLVMVGLSSVVFYLLARNCLGALTFSLSLRSLETSLRSLLDIMGQKREEQGKSFYMKSEKIIQFVKIFYNANRLYTTIWQCFATYMRSELKNEQINLRVTCISQSLCQITSIIQFLTHNKTISMPLQDFQVIAKLGSGVYSSVYKVRRILDGQFYALKKVKLGSLNQKEKENALNEAILLAAIHHPNIIGYREAIIDEESASLCIVMEYAQMGDLNSRITRARQNQEPFDQTFIWKVLISTLAALVHLNQKKIIHRDLKSANLFITSQLTIKLGDLNVSKLLPSGLCFTQTGTPYYASPQIWRDQPYGSKADVWSLGCVVYEMACLRLPFNGEDMETLYKSVTRGVYQRIPSGYSTDLADIVRMMLQVEPVVRPSAQRLLESSIIRKKLKESPELQVLVKQSHLIDENPEIVTQKHFKRKDIYQLARHLPEPNYSRGRVKTLQETRQTDTKEKSKIRLGKEVCPYDYSHPIRTKKSLNQLIHKPNSPLFASKKAAINLLSKRNNVIQLARQQLTHLQTPKLQQIRQHFNPTPFKNLQKFYIKKLIKNRSKTDTSTSVIMKNIKVVREKQSGSRNLGQAEMEHGKDY